MKKTQILILIAISSITLFACRLSDTRSSSAPGIVPTAVAERQSNNETTAVDSDAEGSTSEKFTEPNFENGVNNLSRIPAFISGTLDAVTLKSKIKLKSTESLLGHSLEKIREYL